MNTEYLLDGTVGAYIRLNIKMAHCESRKIILTEVVNTSLIMKNREEESVGSSFTFQSILFLIRLIFHGKGESLPDILAFKGHTLRRNGVLKK